MLNPYYTLNESKAKKTINLTVPMVKLLTVQYSESFYYMQPGEIHTGHQTLFLGFYSRCVSKQVSVFQYPT